METPHAHVFLSHSTRDKPAVKQLAEWLEQEGIRVWLDAWNLIPGEPWQPALEAALAACSCCAVFIGPGGIGPWENEEMRAAIARRVNEGGGRFRVIPVLLPGVERPQRSGLPAFLTATTWVEFRQSLDEAEARHRLLSGIHGREPGRGPGAAAAEGACPFRGLRPFEIEDALFFAGREALTGWLIDRLRPARGRARFLALAGASGSGKSSLARAGVLAALARGEIAGSESWPAVACKPGAQPLESLAIALVAGGTRQGGLRSLIDDLLHEPRTLHREVLLRLAGGPEERCLVVLADQFEEVFTLCGDEGERRAFVDNLLHAATVAGGRTLVVLTVRSDYLGQCAAYPELARALSEHQELVGPLSRDELRRAIERPAQLVGCELEPGLTELLLRETAGHAGTLPLLQHALLELWQRRQGRRLTVAAYEAIGGVAGALGRHADAVFASLAAGEQETCRRVMLRLIQPGPTAAGARRRVPVGELMPGDGDEREAVERLVERLAAERLVTTEAAGVEGRPSAELAHEALIRNWPRLGDWIEHDREALLVRQRLDDAMGLWESGGRDASDLYRGARLAQAEEWAEDRPEDANEPEREFLAASVARRDRERREAMAQVEALRREEQRRAEAERERAEEQSRRAEVEHLRAEEQEGANARLRAQRRLLARATAVAAGLALVAAALALTSWSLKRSADRQRLRTVARELPGHALAALQGDPSLGLLLAVESVRRAEHARNAAQAETVLRQALAGSRGGSLGSEPVRRLAVSPDGRWLATAGTTVTVWDLALKDPALRPSLLAGPHGRIEQIAIGPQGRFVAATASGEEIPAGLGVVLWDRRRAFAPVVAFPGEDWLGASPFGPGGRWLLTRAFDLVLRELTPDAQLREVAALAGGSAPPAFSPDGRWLALGARDGSTAVLDLQRQRPPQRLEDRRSPVTAVGWDPTGRWLAAADAGGRVMVQRWSGGPEGPPVELPGCGAPLPELALHGDWLAARGEGAACLWNLAAPAAAPRRLTGRAGRPATAIAFSPQGRWLATVHGTSVERWDLGAAVAGRPLVEAGSPIHFLAFGAGHRLITAGTDGPPRLWDLRRVHMEDPEEPHVLRPTGPAPARLALGPGGHRMATVPVDGHILLRDLDRPAERAQDLAIDLGPVADVALGRHGLAVLGETYSVVFWEKPGAAASRLPLLGMVALALSGDDRWLAVGGADGRTLLWDVRRKRAWGAGNITNHDGRITALAFGAGPSRLATAGADGKARVWALDPGSPCPRVSVVDRRPQQGLFTTLALSPGDCRLATGREDGAVELWTVARRRAELLGALPAAHRGQVLAAAFSPDGRLLATGGRDRTVRLWTVGDAAPAAQPVVLTEHEAEVRALAFSPDGRTLTTAAADGTVRRWSLRLDELIELACRTAARNLTRPEWDFRFTPERYRTTCPDLR